MEDNIRQIYKIAKFRFDTYAEYQAGERDVKKIAGLGVKKSMNYADVATIAKKIKDDDVVFESKIGEAFLSSLDHRLKTYHKVIVRRLLATLCYAVIAGCFTFFLITGFLEYRSKRAMDELRTKIEQEEAKEKLQEEAGGPEDLGNIRMIQNIEETFSESSGQSDCFSEETVNIQKILPKYKDIYKENNDFVGWLKINDIGIDYPVMQGPDNAYYLSHNFERKYDKNGMLILDVECKLSDLSPQYIIYGHNVQSGRMFGELLNYKDKAYWKYHPVINFDTIKQEAEYEIVSVFLVSLDEPTELAKFYQKKTFADKDEFDDYISLIRDNSIYDTGVNPVYGEPLLTLVTCDDSVNNGRFVVIAGRKQQ